ncbi:histidine kinase [Corynebacteriaceae bacterium 7-707]
MRFISTTPARRGAEALSAVAFGLVAAVPGPGLMTIVLLGLVAVALGAWSRGLRVGLWGLGVLIVVSVARAFWFDGHWIFLSEELPPALLRAGVPWLVTVTLRQYVNLGRQADQERELRRREQLTELERRATAERLDLARSLHDDLGHSLSLVALTVGRLELDASLPESSRVALSNARQEVAHAVERLGSSVVNLRTGDPLNFAVTKSAEAVIRKARDAGVHIDVTGLPNDHRLQAFGWDIVPRILREAITNATRHAPGETIAVDAVDTGDRLQLSVSNRVRLGCPAGHTSGTGLAELAQALTACGGHLEVSQQNGRFIVAATIPLVKDTLSRSREGGQDVGGDGLPPVLTRRARRRLVVVAVVVIVGGLAVGEAASYFQKSQAALSAEDFASISVGDARKDVLPLLPDHELPPRRDETRRPDCHYYAATANTFDDAAGDVHQVCFDGDSVVELGYITGESR